METFNEAKDKEHATMIRARQIALNLNLNMKIGDVEDVYKRQGGILNAFAWPLTVYRKQLVFIVYCVDYQGI